MNKNKKIILIHIYIICLLFVLPFSAYATFEYYQMAVSTGMANIAYAENPSGLTSEVASSSQSSSKASGAISSLSLKMDYELYDRSRKSHRFLAIVPLMSTGTDSYFSGEWGMNFYFLSPSSKGIYKDVTNTLKILPKWRYYWGFITGAGYLVYKTKSAKKNDIIFEIGLNAGTSYSVNATWGINCEVGVVKGTGIMTSTTNMRGFIGGTYYFE
ncbi:MAG: hypothetical protein HQK49_03660 [Oligoflexia bacterium]|nr:hypothetical protein [Oligoflexia bacterium]